MAAFSWSKDTQLLIVLGLFALIIAVLAAFWFSSIARDMFQEDHRVLLERYSQERERMLLQAEREKADIASEKSQLQEQHAKEREQILLAAEREKAHFASESYRQLEKEIRKAHSKANLKVAGAFSLAAAAGGLMIFSQLITVGMMVLVASGSGLAGYLARARHERLSRQKNLVSDEIKMIGK